MEINDENYEEWLKTFERKKHLDAVIDAAREVDNSKFDTYKARNGRDCGIEDQSGEKCFIVPHEPILKLAQAVQALNKYEEAGE
jgi:hypothetical protein